MNLHRPPLHVAVNLLWCRPGRVGGAEEYLARQLAGLASSAPEISGRLVAPPGFARAHPELSKRFEIVEGPAITAHRTGRLIEEIRWLPTQLRNADVLHHGGGTVPVRSPRPIVLTIHDLQYRQFPHYFSRARLTYLRWAMPRSARKATVVAVPSEFVKQTVIEAFALDPDRVAIVPHGVDRSPKSELVDEAGLRRRYGLGRRRILVYPAVTYPHKQHEFLVELLAGPLAEEDVVLVLLGGRGRADQLVTKSVVRRGVAARVVRPGRVPDADRDGLIRIAEALVFPSEYEGFGAPVLEAMALGTPVVCSDRTALPEVVGDAALVTPLSIEAWAVAIRRARDERPDIVARGHGRALRFTVQASGRALATAYHLAAAISD